MTLADTNKVVSEPASKLSIWVSREIYFGRERRPATRGLGRVSRAAARKLGRGRASLFSLARSRPIPLAAARLSRPK